MNDHSMVLHRTDTSSRLVFCFLLLLSNLVETDSFVATRDSGIGASVRNYSQQRLSTTSDAAALSLETVNDESKTKRRAIVVGGGPVGLAAALTLSNAPHFFDVTVYESSKYDEYRAFDPAKAYLYLVNGRGQQLTKKFPSLHEKLRTNSVPSTTRFGLIPPRPDQPIPEPRAFSVTPKSKDPINVEGAEEPGYWIPRHMFTNLLHETVQAQEQERLAGGSMDSIGSITCHFGRKCTDIFPSEDNQSITVCTKDHDSGEEFAAEGAKLVVGGDGMNSRVRESLNTGADRFASLDPDCSAKKFRVKRRSNAATNLRLKALLLPPRFKILADVDGNSVETNGPISYSISGKNTGPRNFLKLGCLPMLDNDSVRPANVITRPDHEVWKIKTGEEMRSWMQENYPRMNFKKESEGGMISDEEWDRFARAEGIRFPYDQYSPGLQVSSSSSGTKDNDCGIVLLGDAAHSFPPSIGQGINAGLADVLQLDSDLKGEGGDAPGLSEALRRYEKKRVPETKSLIRLSRFGSPYQYSQPHYIDRVRKFLWTINILMRIVLNKISFGILQPPMLMMVMNKDLSYRQMARRADLTTAALMTALISLFLKIALKRM